MSNKSKADRLFVCLGICYKTPLNVFFSVLHHRPNWSRVSPPVANAMSTERNNVPKRTLSKVRRGNSTDCYVLQQAVNDKILGLE